MRHLLDTYIEAAATIAASAAGGTPLASNVTLRSVIVWANDAKSVLASFAFLVSPKVGSIQPKRASNHKCSGRRPRSDD